jgi:microfibrillar-associated protein 1
MSSPRDPFSILSKNQGPDGYKKPQPKAKVQRYRKGVGPEHEEPEDDDNDDIYQMSHFTAESDKHSVAESGFTEKVEDEELSARIRNRRRVRPTVVVEESETNQEETSQDQKESIPAKSAAHEKVRTIEEEDDLEDVARRRAKARERLLEQERIEEENNEQQQMEEEEEEEIEEEQEIEEEDAGETISMLKPVFVSKRDRDTNEKKMEEEDALREEENKIKEKRLLETKMLLIEANRAGDDVDKDDENLSHGEMPNDDDELDETDKANEFAEWRIRELRRIKKEREGRVKRDKEKAEIERRRRLTDAERAHENKVLGSDDTEKGEKTKYRFMQTYYHKGGFFQDSSDPIFQRDYNLAVGEEIRDKTMLPKAMQVRRDKFGKKGQTKYTHLNDQDTTNFDPFFKVDENLREQARMKQGGYKSSNIFDSKKKH